MDLCKLQELPKVANLATKLNLLRDPWDHKSRKKIIVPTIDRYINAG